VALAWVKSTGAIAIPGTTKENNIKYLLASLIAAGLMGGVALATIDNDANGDDTLMKICKIDDCANL
tara:strand:- start:527 stop:727 length:201 start_codon:yes stop_codon:yes gene_type:complete